MSLTFNGADVKEFLYNGTALKQMDYNGVTVFKKDEWSDKPYVAFIEENGEKFTLQTEVYNDSTINKKKSWNGTLYYSVDGETWSTWGGTTQLSSSNDGKLFLRGKNNTYLTKATISDTPKYFRFALQNGKRIQCHGNIENLLNYETVLAGNHPTMDTLCYGYMFNGCTSLTTAPKLPATTLALQCYRSMFNGCTSLTTAPELPATTLPGENTWSRANGCYEAMFYKCTSLTSAPDLPATTLRGSSSYYQMFYGCVGLIKPPEKLAAASLPSYTYTDMFYGCTSLTGTIHCPASVASDNNRLTASANNVPSTVTVLYDL